MASYHDYQESLGESTETTTTFQTKVTSSTTLTSGVTYLLIWSCQTRNDNTGGSCEARLRDHTGSVTLQGGRFGPKDTTDYIFFGSAATFTAASTGTNEFRIEFCQNGTGTGSIKNARLLILALDAGDFATSSTGASSTTSGSFQDKCTLSVNGAAAGDYLFVAGAITNTDAQNTEIQGLQTDGSTPVNTASGLWINTTVGAPYSAIWVETLSGANVSAKLQYRSLDGGSVNITTAYLVAINTASLGDAYVFTRDNNDDAGTDTVATDSETVSGSGVDTVGGDVIVIAAANYKGSSSTVSSQVDFREGSTTIIESFHEDQGATNADDVVGIVGYLSSSANDPETWKWRRRSESGSSTTTTVRYAAIAALGLAADSVSGSASITEANDSLSGAGKVYITGALSKTEANDSLSGAGKLYIAGALSKTEANDSVSAAGNFFTNGTASITEASDSLSGAGMLPIVGALSKTEANDSLSGAGALPVVGTLSKTEANDSVSAAGTLPIYGTVSQTEASDSLVGEGILPIVGSASIAEAGDTLEASDYIPRGRFNVTEEGDFLRATMEVPIEWYTAQAIRGDRPNWNQCARCGKKVRPNKLIMQTQWVGPRMVATGVRVCSSCLDVPNPSDRWTGYVEIGGDPRPVPNPRPRRD